MKTYDRAQVLQVAAQLFGKGYSAERSVADAKALLDEVERQCPPPGKPEKTAPCECEPDAEPDEPGDDRTHYLRTCQKCGNQWEGLHCPHDGFQNPCPRCNQRPSNP